MPVARKILADPPPLTPRALRQFPFVARTFPFATLRDGANLTTNTANAAPQDRPASVNRVQ